MPGARVVHEDATHDASGHREEMRAVVPRDGLRVDQPEIRLVDERRRLKAVTRALVPYVPPRDLMELSMDERNQPIEGRLVALPPFEKEPGDLRGMVRNATILSPFLSPFRPVQVFATASRFRQEGKSRLILTRLRK